MANTKKNNYIYNKKNNQVVANKNNNYKKQQNKKNNNSAKMTNNPIKNDNLSVKERNKQKYENRKKRYAQGVNSKNIKPKKKLNIEETMPIKEEKTKSKKILNGIDVNVSKKKNITNKTKEKKGLEQTKNTIYKIKEKQIKIINDIKDKTSDNLIPLGNEKKDNKKRVKRYFKEALVYAIIITLVNIIAIYVFDYANILKLFDIRYVNIILTILLSLIFNLVLAFFVDCLVTEIWVKVKEKHKVGEQNGNIGSK